MRRSTVSGSKNKNCCEYIVNSIQYLVAIVLILVYFLFLPTIPYFALFSERFAYLQVGYINDNYFHCTYDNIKIERNGESSNISNNTNNTNIAYFIYYIDYDNIIDINDADIILSQHRRDTIYWDIFLIFCIISSIFGYWVVLFCPAFRLCVKYNYCSWKAWILSSIISLLFVISALILAMKKQCKNEVIELYKNNNNNNNNTEDIDITDTEFGYCLWYLVILIILNTMIICICVWMRNDDISEYRQSFHQIITRKTTYKYKRSKSQIRRRAESSYRCENCNDYGYVTNCCCCNKKACPVCTTWEELDDF